MREEETIHQNAQQTALKGLKFQKVPGDGHCLFHAIGLYLGEDALFLRKIVSAHLEANFDEFKVYRIGNDEEFRSYINAIRNGQEWGDHIEIEIIQKITDRPIIIIRSDVNPILPTNLEKYNGDPIFIYYDGYVHYDAFLLEGGVTAKEILAAIKEQLAQRQPIVYVVYKEPITPKEYALMAKAAYERKDVSDNFGLDEDWVRTDALFPENQWNFGISAFLNEATKQLVFSLKGTETSSIWDLLTDFGIAKGQIPANVAEGEKFIGKKRSDLLSKEKKVCLEAALAAMNRALNRDLVTENASPENKIYYDLFLQLFKRFSGVSLALLALSALVLLPLILSLQGSIPIISPILASLGLSKKSKKDLIVDYRKLASDDFDSKEIEKVTDEIKKTFPQYKISITGHSLGASMAEIIAARIGIPAITFDSPGTKDMIEIDQKAGGYQCNPKQFITFLSAPNFINCCNPHIGTCYRIYIPHVEGDWTWSHAASSLFGSTARVVTYTAAIGAVVFTGGAALGAESAVVAGGAALSDVAVQTLFRNWTWTMRQHNKDNIVACFTSRGYPPASTAPKVWLVKNWPYLLDRLSASRLKRAGKYFQPFSESNRGIHNITNENSVIEAQTNELPNYEVEELSNPESSIFDTIKQAFEVVEELEQSNNNDNNNNNNRTNGNSETTEPSFKL